MESLRETRAYFERVILRGHADPLHELVAAKLRLVVGPAGSALLAMVRVPVSGGRALYRRIANRAIFEDAAARDLIESRFLSDGLRFVAYRNRNPAIVDIFSGKVVEALEWHHSPNHVMTVCLIPRQLHRQPGLHAKGRGGQSMFWIGNQNGAKANS